MGKKESKRKSPWKPLFFCSCFLLPPFFFPSFDPPQGNMTSEPILTAELLKGLVETPWLSQPSGCWAMNGEGAEVGGCGRSVWVVHIWIVSSFC